MKHCRIIVRGRIIMPWTPTDEDLKIMNCYFESPVFSVETDIDIFDILDYAYDRYFTDFSAIRIVDSLELVNVNDA